MNLALKTAGAETELFIIDGSGAGKAHHEWVSGRTLSDKLLAEVQAFLAKSHAEITGLTGIVIFSGPGSFTSLRIGHTVANALADSRGIPVAGAQGDNWLVAGAAALKHTKPGVPALPHYGAEAHITKPKN